MEGETGDEPKILGYEVAHTDVGWEAKYLGLLTDKAFANGCERVLVDENLARLRIRAVKNRVKAWSWEYEPPEDDVPA